MSDKKDERRNAMKSRFQERGESDQSKTDDTPTSSDSSNSSSSANSANSNSPSSSSRSSKSNKSSSSTNSGKKGVREKRGVTMYLPDDLVDDLDFRFDELNVKYRREYGEKMEKNKDFYPAMVQATINNTTVEEELGLTE